MTDTDGIHALPVRPAPPPPPQALRTLVRHEAVVPGRAGGCCANIHCTTRIRRGHRVYVCADGRIGHIGCIVDGWPEGYVQVAHVTREGGRRHG